MPNENTETYPEFVTEVSNALRASNGVILGTGDEDIRLDSINMHRHYEYRVVAGPEIVAEKIAEEIGLSRIDAPKP